MSSSPHSDFDLNANVSVSDTNPSTLTGEPSQSVGDSSALKMTSSEKSASWSLAFVYAMRMLGLFMVLPIFVLEAQHYAGGDDPTKVGMAMGVYGLVQAFLQIPFGIAADRFGRKKVIQFGLFLFVVGSCLGAVATSVDGLALGRALQGCGAVSAAVTALLADQTRDHVRTFGMALIGASIGLMFAFSLVLGPVLSKWGGLSGVFAVTAVLGLLAMAALAWWTPREPSLHNEAGLIAVGSETHALGTSPINNSFGKPNGNPNGNPEDNPEYNLAHGLRATLLQPDLLRLNVGVFVLYAVQLANWASIPAMLSAAGVSQENHGWVYLPAVLLSFVVMGGTLFPMERKGMLKPLFLGSIVLVALVELGWYTQALSTPGLYALELLLFLFFCGFNILEASQPSLASKMAAPATRGATMGVYNTLQSLGIFAGAVGGGWLTKSYGPGAVFLVCSCLMVFWLIVAAPMRVKFTKIVK